MAGQRMRVLISGASVAGPMVAYWLSRYGFSVTVVERMPLSRVRTGGHAVDLFGPAMEVADWMGVLPAVLDARTQTETLSFQRSSSGGVEIDLRKMMAGISDRHVEVMRGELATILYEAGRDDVDYRFEDSIRTLDQQPDGVAVTFEQAPPERFDLVVGADGLHSTVRRLAFGSEDRFRRFLGGYLAIFVLPDYLSLGRRMVVHNEPGRMAALYPVRQTGMARAGFIFRRGVELPVDHRDTGGQKRAVREIYGSDGWEVPRLLDAMDAAEDFYFDSISQVVMESSTQGRVALVGDSGYSPGPAVGGGTSQAVVGAYVLAEELARAGADYQMALRRYEDRMRAVILSFRRIGPVVMKNLIPRTRLQLSLMPSALKIITSLPGGLQRRLSKLQAAPARALEAARLTRPRSAA